MEPWTVLESRYLLRRKWMNLREEHLRLPGGAEIEEFHVLEYPDWACVVCRTEEGQVVMVEQYRRGIARASLELPAGVINTGEDPLAGARRELLEETGYASDDWASLGRFAPEPSRQTNYAHLYFARGARRIAAPQLDATEELHVRLVDPAELVRRARSGEIVHGLHVLAVLQAVQHGLLAG